MDFYYFILLNRKIGTDKVQRIGIELCLCITERSRNYSRCQLQIKSRFPTTAQAFQFQMFMILRYIGFISKEVNECSSQTQNCCGPDRSHKEEKTSQ